jgi:hypothetical protein
MYKTISNKIIREFKPYNDPSKFIKDENEELPIKDWVQKYRKVVPSKDIFWILLRKEFLSEKDLRLFAIWSARELFKSIKNPDERIVYACNVAERYANGEATQEELLAARDAASDAVNDAVAYQIYYTASTAACDAAYIAAADDAYYVSADAYDTAYIVTLAFDTVSYSANYYVSYTVYYTSYAAQLDKLLTYFE